MTFMDEIDGEAYRIKITNVYEYTDNNVKNNSKNNLRSKSLMRLIEAKEQEKKERENGKIISNSSTINLNEFLPQYNLNENISSLINLSGVEIKQIKEIEQKQNNLIKELGPNQGFDLNKIKYHYNHRRKMRYMHESIRRGKLIYLQALDNKGEPHQGILAFARKTEEEIGIFVINFRENETNFSLDLSNLLGKDIDFNSICYIEDWDNENEKGEYYFLRELTEGHLSRKIWGYHSLSLGFSIVPFTEENYRKTIEKSNLKMLNEISKKETGNTVDNYQITIQLKDILTKKLSLEEFNKWLIYLTDILDKSNISLNDYIKNIDFISNDEKLNTEFFSYCFKLLKTKKKNMSQNDLKYIL